MALRRKDVNKAEAPAPETKEAPEMVETTVTEPKPKPEPKPKAEVPATKPKAAPVARGTATLEHPVLADKESVFVPQFGVLPGLRASNGSILGPDKSNLGRWIDIQVLSWHRLWIVGPCDNKAPKELVKYSLDGENLEDGSGLVRDWVAELKAADWHDAASKEYREIVAYLKAAEVADSPLIGEMVQLRLAPTSVKAFENYIIQTTFKVSTGMVPAEGVDNLRVTAEIVSWEGNDWTKLSFKQA
jgi:hypothetical protein